MSAIVVNRATHRAVRAHDLTQHLSQASLTSSCSVAGSTNASRMPSALPSRVASPTSPRSRESSTGGTPRALSPSTARKSHARYGNPHVADHFFESDTFHKAMRKLGLVEPQARALARTMAYQRLGGGETVFQQGDVGVYFYIVLSGTCLVQVAAKGEDGAQRSAVVAEINAGGSFGELALERNAARRATIITKEPTEFLKVDKDTYTQTLKAAFQRQLRSKFQFLRRLPIFGDLPVQTVRKLSEVLSFKSFTAGQVVFREGDKARDMLLVKSGSLAVEKAVPICEEFDENPLQGNDAEAVLLVGELRKNTYFGVAELESDDKKGSRRQATVTCQTDCVVAFIDKFDLRHNVDRYTRVCMPDYTVRVPDELDAKNMYHMQKQSQVWRQHRRSKRKVNQTQRPAGQASLMLSRRNHRLGYKCTCTSCARQVSSDNHTLHTMLNSELARPEGARPRAPPPRRASSAGSLAAGAGREDGASVRSASAGTEVPALNLSTVGAGGGGPGYLLGTQTARLRSGTLLSHRQRRLRRQAEEEERRRRNTAAAAAAAAATLGAPATPGRPVNLPSITTSAATPRPGLGGGGGAPETPQRPRGYSEADAKARILGSVVKKLARRRGLGAGTRRLSLAAVARSPSLHSPAQPRPRPRPRAAPRVTLAHLGRQTQRGVDIHNKHRRATQ